MSKCQAKVEKTVPGMLWGTNKSWEDCPEEAKEGGKFCREHGCRHCSYQTEGNKISWIDGVSLVCSSCKEKDFQKKFENNRRLSELEKEVESTKNLLLGLNKKFFGEISEIIDKLNNYKRQVISRSFSPVATITDYEVDYVFGRIIDHYHSVLTESERESWKGVYQGKGGDLEEIIVAEKAFLPQLAKERNQQESNVRERERERRKLLIQGIKTELANSPPVDISELPSTFHNYESWTANELENSRDSIFQAIQNKRIEKKLPDLLNQAENCSEDDLWDFIQKLEKLFSATALPAEQEFYSTHRNEVDTILNKLKKRWDNLSEEQKLTGYWNQAIREFKNQLKAAEDLQLTATDPFANFTEDIKKFKTWETITAQEKAAEKHILAQFKEAVKKELGAEQQTNEYREIEQGNTLAEVKLAREKIRQERKSPKNRLPQTSPNSGESASKMIIRVMVTIGGGIIILGLIGLMVKKWKKRKKI